MGAEVRNDYLGRTEALLGPEAMRRLEGACVAVAGLGGVGGAVLAALVRMGVGRFRIADPEVFDPPDLNRQWAATRETLGSNKTVAYERHIRSVNPKADVAVFPEGVTEANCEEVLDGADLVIEALDVAVPPALRKAVHDAARRRGVHSMLPPIIGFGTMVATAAPGGMPMDRFLAFLERARADRRLPPGIARFFNPVHVARMEAAMAGGVIPSAAIATMLVGSVVATEAVLILARDAVSGGREPVCLPNLILMDLSTLTVHVRPIEEVEAPMAAVA